MKKVIEPNKKEVAEYYCDFSGERFLHDIPEVTLKFYFGYGSRFDDSEVEFHLTEKESFQILNMIKNKLSEKTKLMFEKSLNESEACFESALHSRDYNGCDYYSANREMYNYFLNKNER